MLNKFFFNSIVYFACGLLFGYASCVIYDKKLSTDRKKRRKNSETITKEVFEQELRKIYSLLNSIQKRLNDKIESRSNNYDDDAATTEITDDTDDCNDQELFFDTAEILKDDNEIDSVEECDNFEQIDQMFDTYDKRCIYDALKQRLPIVCNKIDKQENNANFLWRLAKAAHFFSKTFSNNNKEDQTSRKDLLFESFEYASKALKLDDKNADCHKWYAISIGCLSDFVSIKEKISNGIKFKDHLEIAMSLKENDPTLYHLAGRFCVELLSISWAERKIAGIIYGGALPSITYQEALDYFYKAYNLKPKWKENLLFIVQTLIQIKQNEKAIEFLNEGLSLPVDDDEQTVQDKLLKIQNSICT